MALTQAFKQSLQSGTQSVGISGGVVPGQAMTPEQAQQWINGSTPSAASDPRVSHLSDIADAFTGGINKIGEGMEEARPASDKPEGLLDSAGHLVQGVGKIIGGAAQAVTSPLAPVFKPVSNIINDATQPIQNNPSVQKFAMSPAGETTSNVASTVADYSNAAGTVAGIKGTVDALPSTIAKVKGAVDTVKNSTVPPAIGAATTVKNAVTNPIDTIKTAIAKTVYGKDAAKIQASLKASYDKIPLPKGVMQEEAQTGKSFSDFMSQKPYLSMDVQNGKWNTYDTAQTLRAEAKPEAQALQNLLDSSAARVSEQDLITQMKSAVESVASGQERAGIQQFVEREVPTLIDQMGGETAVGPNGERMVSLADLNKIKQTLWDRSPFKPTASRADNLKSSVDYKMGQVIRQNIENSVDDADVRALNGEIGDYYHAIETLENLHGGAAPGGRIGSLFTKVAGAVAGSPGGAVGSIAGYMTADKISELMMNPAITTAIKREALNQLKVARPTVAGQVAKILQKRATESAARPKLPSPSFIPMGEYKGGAGTTPMTKAPLAEKGPVGFDPNSARFKTTFTSTQPDELQQNLHTYLDILGSK